MTLFEFIQKSNEFYNGMIEEVSIATLSSTYQEIWPGPYDIVVQNNQIHMRLTDDSIETVMWALKHF